jgi:hypothetical protein
LYLVVMLDLFSWEVVGWLVDQVAYGDRYGGGRSDVGLLRHSRQDGPGRAGQISV